MKDDSRDAAARVTPPAAGKLAYAAPTLREHGKVHLLTQGTKNKGNDGRGQPGGNIQG